MEWIVLCAWCALVQFLILFFIISAFVESDAMIKDPAFGDLWCVLHSVPLLRNTAGHARGACEPS